MAIQLARAANGSYASLGQFPVRHCCGSVVFTEANTYLNRVIGHACHMCGPLSYIVWVHVSLLTHTNWNITKNSPVGRQRASLGTCWSRCNLWPLCDPHTKQLDTGNLLDLPDHWPLRNKHISSYTHKKIYIFINKTTAVPAALWAETSAC